MTDKDALRQLLARRLQRFTSLLSRVLEDEDPNAVHDIRVGNRRLQQALGAFFPKPRPGRVRKLRRTLRKMRRALSEWRNCDVLIELIEEEWRNTSRQQKQLAWKVVQESIRQKRSQQVALARKQLGKHDIGKFSKRLLAVLDDSMAKENIEGPADAVYRSIERAWSRWRSALSRAQEIRDSANIHAFRVATKRLRYRVELKEEFEDARAKPVLRWLKELQEMLGRWHDREALHQEIADVLSRPEILARLAGAEAALLVETERDREEQEVKLEEIFRRAAEDAARDRLHAWLSST